MTTKTTHTPGPWHRNIKPVTKYVTVWSGRNTHVAYVNPSGLSAEEVEANICLIAAAPTLLESLQELLEFYAGHKDKNRISEDERDMLDDAENAIAKAEGE